MNTANLQLEGLYLAVAALTSALRDKGLLTEAEIDAALTRGEEGALRDPALGSLSSANQDAVCFPFRFLRLANEVSAQGEVPSFYQLAKRVGETKPGH